MADIHVFEHPVVFKGDVVFLGDVQVNGTVVTINHVHATQFLYDQRTLTTRWDLVKAFFSRRSRG